jgi:hypothetical protein
MAEFPILEYDPDRDALISPSVTTLRPSGGEPIPRVAVACFFQEVIESECVRAGARVVAILTRHSTRAGLESRCRGDRTVAGGRPYRLHREVCTLPGLPVRADRKRREQHDEREDGCARPRSDQEARG